MHRAAVRRSLMVLICSALAVSSVAASAQPDSTLSRALHARKAYVRTLSKVGNTLRNAKQLSRVQIKKLDQMIARHRAQDPEVANYRQRLASRLRFLVGVRRGLRIRIGGLEKHLRRRIQSLRWLRTSVSEWILTFGIFRACPVRSPHAIADNFGYVVQKRPGVPRHVHQGNDIAAAYAAPILAPFDGTATASTNTLGGLAVTVHGTSGYVYNAHLSSYGELGDVQVGDVIGYVGTTGDALGPHDHFEWHPGDGTAVDPYPFLMAVC